MKPKTVLVHNAKHRAGLFRNFQKRDVVWIF